MHKHLHITKISICKKKRKKKYTKMIIEQIHWVWKKIENTDIKLLV